MASLDYLQKCQVPTKFNYQRYSVVSKAQFLANANDD